MQFLLGVSGHDDSLSSRIGGEPRMVWIVSGGCGMQPPFTRSFIASAAINCSSFVLNPASVLSYPHPPSLLLSYKSIADRAASTCSRGRVMRLNVAWAGTSSRSGGVGWVRLLPRYAVERTNCNEEMYGKRRNKVAMFCSPSLPLRLPLKHNISMWVGWLVPYAWATIGRRHWWGWWCSLLWRVSLWLRCIYKEPHGLQARSAMMVLTCFYLLILLLAVVLEIYHQVDPELVAIQINS